VAHVCSSRRPKAIAAKVFDNFWKLSTLERSPLSVHRNPGEFLGKMHGRIKCGHLYGKTAFSGVGPVAAGIVPPVRKGYRPSRFDRRHGLTEATAFVVRRTGRMACVKLGSMAFTLPYTDVKSSKAPGGPLSRLDVGRDRRNSGSRTPVALRAILITRSRNKNIDLPYYRTNTAHRGSRPYRKRQILLDHGPCQMTLSPWWPQHRRAEIREALVGHEAGGFA